eukprot:TRINITY_DN3484_c0_g2_i6.p1 TRINITY_DN3484_c0_g2~~TRINITY_DN3484_c0_g2_i6.p1  ORF type:complete len:242 (+),score=43.47 TRINITY_DN3484_c0_g2_i6:372-1097(+)
MYITANTCANGILRKMRGDSETDRKREAAVDSDFQLQAVCSQRELPSVPTVELLPRTAATQSKREVLDSLHESTFEEIDMRSEESDEAFEEEDNLDEVKKKLNEIAKQMRTRLAKRPLKPKEVRNAAAKSKGIHNMVNNFLDKAGIIIKSQLPDKEQLHKLKVLITSMQREYKIYNPHISSSKSLSHKGTVDTNESIQKYQLQIDKIRQENSNLKSLVSDIEASIVAVSYTHLTLPTIYSV